MYRAQAKKYDSQKVLQTGLLSDGGFMEVRFYFIELYVILITVSVHHVIHIRNSDSVVLVESIWSKSLWERGTFHCLHTFTWLRIVLIDLLLNLPVLFVQLTGKDVYLCGVKYWIIVVIVP